MSDDKTEPKVGYKNPPKQHQIKPGERRNPRGRPPKAERAFLPTQTVRDILAVTEEERKVRTPQGVRKITTFEASLRRLVQRGLEGHGPSLRYVIKLHAEAVKQHHERFSQHFSLVELIEDELITKPAPPENERYSRKLINDLRKTTRKT